MANELNYIGTGSTSGLTLAVDVFNPDGSLLQADIAATEAGSNDVYTSDFPAPQPTGKYMFRYKNTADDSVVAIGEIVWDGVNQEEQATTALNSNIQKLITATFEIVKTMPNTRPGRFNGKIN